MKKTILSLAILGLVSMQSCNKDAKAETVETDVQTVTGENVADAQKDLNKNVADAQDAVNSAQKELDEAKAKGDQVLIGAAQKKIDELQMNLDMIKKQTGEDIRSTNGNMDGANKALDNKTEAAEKQLDNIENTAEKVEDKVKK